jgi:ribosomal protein L40E
MFTSETAETTDLNYCQACGAAQIDRDKFCRRCGVSQTRRVEQLNYITGTAGYDVAEKVNKLGYETRPLPDCGTLRRSYSGRLVGIVTQELSERTSAFRANRCLILLISMLIAVPLWLIIVLLSPLDVYIAAKNLAKQV